GKERRTKTESAEADGDKNSWTRNQHEPKAAAAYGRRVLDSRHDDQQPHGGEDRAALESPARIVGSSPEHVDGDHDAHRRQQPRQACEHALRVGSMAWPRVSAPQAVG